MSDASLRGLPSGIFYCSDCSGFQPGKHAKNALRVVLIAAKQDAGCRRYQQEEIGFDGQYFPADWAPTVLRGPDANLLSLRPAKSRDGGALELQCFRRPTRGLGCIGRRAADFSRSHEKTLLVGLVCRG